MAFLTKFLKADLAKIGFYYFQNSSRSLGSIARKTRKILCKTLLKFLFLWYTNQEVYMIFTEENSNLLESNLYRELQNGKSSEYIIEKYVLHNLPYFLMTIWICSLI